MGRQLYILIPLLTTPVLAAPQGPKISLDSPLESHGVPARTCISGTTSDSTARLVAVVHPTEIAEYFVQPAISPREDGRYKVLAYLGESGLHQGKRFEIRVFGNPKAPLREGQRLAWWPEAESFSPLVEVVRQDGAPDGCGV